MSWFKDKLKIFGLYRPLKEQRTRRRHRYCGTARNHPTARLRQFGRTWERHAPRVAVTLAFAAMLYLAVR